MSSKSRFVPTVKAITIHECPQTMGRIRRKRRIKQRAQKKARAIMHKRRK